MVCLVTTFLSLDTHQVGLGSLSLLKKLKLKFLNYVILSIFRPPNA
jgi:hypothetical protein